MTRTRLLLGLVFALVAAFVLQRELAPSDRALFVAHAGLRGLALLSQARQIEPDATVVFGDSIVEAALIGPLCGRPVLTAGAWGARLADVAGFAPAVVAAARPKTVVVAVGVNDATHSGSTDPETFRTTYRGLIAPWREAGVDVVLATLAPVVAGRPLGDANFDPVRIDRLNRVIRDLATEAGARLAALDALPRAPGGGLDPALSDDGVHPTPDGYRAWRAILARSVCADTPPAT